MTESEDNCVWGSGRLECCLEVGLRGGRAGNQGEVGTCIGKDGWVSDKGGYSVAAF